MTDPALSRQSLYGRALLSALRCLRQGDFGARLPTGCPGIGREIAELFNDIAAQMSEVEYKNRQIEQARASLEEKAEQLALSSRYKSEFVANMSHELRTPLNSLLILARLLAENAPGTLTAKQVEYAQTIHAAGSDLLSLIDDILDLAKIESGTITLNIASERLYDLHYHVERAFRQVAADKGLEFEVEIAPGLPSEIRTDAKRLQQILKNLLSNAFKFTASGKVMLRVFEAAPGLFPGHRRLASAGEVIAFSVMDTGVGIPEGRHKIIFDAFQQADGTTNRQYGGTGLGLSISRELAALLGGEIRVSSTPGQGSNFTLYLPLHPASPAAGTASPLPARRLDAVPGTAAADQKNKRLAQELQPLSRGLTGKTVLVVDDDRRNIFALVSTLHEQGMKVLSAASGREGIRILESEPAIDIVLMDVMMPDLDGYETVRRMRQMERFNNLPIIAITARAMKGDRDKCIEAGASDYLAKPVNVDQLVSLLRVWLLK